MKPCSLLKKKNYILISCSLYNSLPAIKKISMNSDMLTFDPVILALRSLSRISVTHIAHRDMCNVHDNSSSRFVFTYFYP